MDHCGHLLAIIDAQNEIIASELDAQAAIALVVDRARSLTGADAALVELIEGDAMVCAAAAGSAESHLGARTRRDSSLSGICLESKRVLRSDDTAGTDRRVDPEPWADGGSGTVVTVPLYDGETPIGVLKVYFVPPHTLSAADEEALELLGGLTVAQLSRAPGLGGEGRDDHDDPVTELPNRASFEERLAMEAERARRYRYPLALVLLELEGLGQVDAELGSRAKEAVLREVADLMSGSRFADEAFRLGEADFAILLPHTDLAGAEAAAARLTMQISASGFADGRVSSAWGAASDEGHPAALREGAERALHAARDDRRLAGAG